MVAGTQETEKGKLLLFMHANQGFLNCSEEYHHERGITAFRTVSVIRVCLER